MKSELLSPAGSPEKLKYALAYGADAVYAGIPKFSLRAKENPFKDHLLKEAIDYISAGKEVLGEQIPSMGCSIKWKGN